MKKRSMTCPSDLIPLIPSDLDLNIQPIRQSPSDNKSLATK